MTQYFEHFSPVAPMPALSREAALASGTYVERDGDRCRLVFDGELDRVAYLDRADPSAAIADLRTRGESVRAEVYTRVNREGDRARYRVWHLSPTGEVQSLKEFETDGEGNYLRESWIEADGRVGSYREYEYRDGELFEVRGYNAAGKLVSREEA